MDPRPWETFVVHRDAERIVTHKSYVENGRRVWQNSVSVYYVADPPTQGVVPAKIGLPAVPSRYEPVEGVKNADTGGRFILSTGDQCGRDTPDENLVAMIETARTYGRYCGKGSRRR